MNHSFETDAFTALGHPGRLAVFRLLARRAPQGVRPSDIASALSLKPNTLSAYVTTLCRAGLLTTWREGRSVYYGLDLSRMAGVLSFLVNDCCRGRPELCEPISAPALAKLARLHDRGAAPFEVLFVCTGNSARSQFAEAVLNRVGAGRFRAHSAGTKPANAINPMAKAVLAEHGHPTGGLRPKALASYGIDDAGQMDFVFTLCDRAADEDCPPLPGWPVTAHWGIAPPSTRAQAERDEHKAFLATYEAVVARIDHFVALPIHELSQRALQQELDTIGALSQPSMPSRGTGAVHP
ncbi:MAG: ArsR family transcriptional regulator [Pseudomonadota bacterium]